MTDEAFAKIERALIFIALATIIISFALMAVTPK